ncbi:hypothetical protein L3Q82_007475 [Scortum barcoo]|uniref:Uncharacterized protein n=1 Tax=Scortum barcoo TaxID=214431 RepID=A0ACB8WP02_9TELE|nr:hypothetical protein L3Q82_007475 [Scortum barcoo]
MGHGQCQGPLGGNGAQALAIVQWEVEGSLSLRDRLEIVEAHWLRMVLHAWQPWALEPSSLRGAGPSTTLELNRGSGGELVWACLLIAPQLSRHVLEFTPVTLVNERVASLHLRVGDRSLTVVCASTGQNGSTEYLAFLESLGRVLDSSPTEGLHCSTGDFNAHVGNATVIPGGA